MEDQPALAGEFATTEIDTEVLPNAATDAITDAPKQMAAARANGIAAGIAWLKCRDLATDRALMRRAFRRP
jgi:hypothetical protein